MGHPSERTHRAVARLLSVALLTVAMVAAAAAEARPALSPQPRQITWGSRTLILRRPVTLLVTPGATQAAAEAALLVQTVLGSAPQVVRIPRPATTDVHLALTFGASERSDPPSLAAAPDTRGRNLGPEGYLLSTARSGDGTTVCIRALADAGAFYGVQTLRQLQTVTDTGVTVPECMIVDHPAFATRGFKGVYWTPQQYEPMVDWMPHCKLNFLMLCYSLYPETNAAWRQPFSSSQLTWLHHLASRCRRRHIRLCLAINPSLGVDPPLRYSDPNEANSLGDKLLAAYEAGIRSFAICLDDVPLALLAPEDQAAFSDLAQAQLCFMQRVLARLDAPARQVEVLFCPTTYFNEAVATPAAEAYITAVGRGLPPYVQVLWTGPTVWSATITEAEADKFAAWVGRKPFVWDNYPVNDWAPGGLDHGLILGPVRGRSRGLSDHVSGWLSNPMVRSTASRLPLTTVADYLWNPEAYDPSRSLRTAVCLLAGRDAYADVYALARDHAYFMGLPPPTPPTSALSEAEAEARVARLERLRRRLLAASRLESFNADVAPALDFALADARRRLTVLRPPVWGPRGVELTGDSFRGGAADLFGNSYLEATGCNYVYAAPSGRQRMEATFIREADEGPAELVIEGTDGNAAETCRVSFTLNGHEVFAGRSGFPGYPATEWATRRFPVAAEWLRNGENHLVIENQESEGVAGMPPWFMVRRVALEPAAP